MNLSDIIEQYINEMFKSDDTNIIEIKRNEIARQFSCVPSQINYVISTRFIPELGFYVESKKGGNGSIKIEKKLFDDEDVIINIIKKIGNKLSQNVASLYLANLLEYNIIDEKIYEIILAAISDKSLSYVDQNKKDNVRACIFKNILINI